MRMKLLTVSKGKMKLCEWGARMVKMRGDLRTAARKHMEDLAWTNEKREGVGDIVYLFIRAFYTRSL